MKKYLFMSLLMFGTLFATVGEAHPFEKTKQDGKTILISESITSQSIVLAPGHYATMTASDSIMQESPVAEETLNRYSSPTTRNYISFFSMLLLFTGGLAYLIKTHGNKFIAGITDRMHSHEHIPV